MYMCLGNHTAESRTPDYGKVVLAAIWLPPMRTSDNVEHYRYCSRVIFHKYYEYVLEVLALWEPGFLLTLPGDSKPSVFQIRLGLVQGDLLECRLMGGVLSSFSVRCCTKLGGSTTTEGSDTAHQDDAAGALADDGVEDDEEEDVVRDTDTYAFDLQAIEDSVPIPEVICVWPISV